MPIIKNLIPENFKKISICALLEGPGSGTKLFQSYIDNHPEFNILLSNKVPSYGLYTYTILNLLTKINPLLLFNKDTNDIYNNYENYLVDKICIYDINNINNLLLDVGYKSTTNTSNISNYIEYYDNDMIDKIKKHDKFIFDILLSKSI